jgi:hypothetical protein
LRSWIYKLQMVYRCGLRMRFRPNHAPGDWVTQQRRVTHCRLTRRGSTHGIQTFPLASRVHVFETMLLRPLGSLESLT